MEALDTFSRTFLPATALAKLPDGTVARHVQVLRRCAGDRDAVAVVARCTTSRGRRNVLMLTRNRLVVTSESAVLRRVALHLNADLHQLADVTWTPEPDRVGIQLGVTAIDGVRENFWIRLGSKAEMWRLDEALKQAFRTPLGVIEPARTPKPAGARTTIAAPATARATAAVKARPELRLA
ncbi:hypothetical protein [Dactylosporangium sp. NPDC051541]|uniref:hypothetical protein n=1 Tax=Dactylosporangium sp. NPDC051541 TaxID=3363977 RepID=UPI0037B8CA54